MSNNVRDTHVLLDSLLSESALLSFCCIWVWYKSSIILNKISIWTSFYVNKDRTEACCSEDSWHFRCSHFSACSNTKSICCCAKILISGVIWAPWLETRHSTDCDASALNGGSVWMPTLHCALGVCTSLVSTAHCWLVLATTWLDVEIGKSATDGSALREEPDALLTSTPDS